VLLDGSQVGWLPASLERVPTGGHVVVVAADGYEEWSGKLTLEHEKESKVQVDLVPEPGGAPLAVAAPEPAAEPPPDEPARPSSVGSWLPYAMAGIGVGVLGAGVGVFVQAQGFFDEADSYKAAYDAATSSRVAEGQRFNTGAAQADGERTLLLSQVLNGTGAALVAAGAVLFLVSRQPSDETSSPPRVFVAPGGLGLVVPW